MQYYPVKVSVITPVFNGAQTIADTIESVLSQTLTTWEHIIVDDGSYDLTAEIVHKYLDARIQYYYQENAGRSKTRNKGIALASGEYLIFLDADDCLLPNALEDHVNFLEKTLNIV